MSFMTEIWGRAFEGVLDYDVISRFVGRMAWQAQKVTLDDANAFRCDGSGSVFH